MFNIWVYLLYCRIAYYKFWTYCTQSEMYLQTSKKHYRWIVKLPLFSCEQVCKSHYIQYICIHQLKPVDVPISKLGCFVLVENTTKVNAAFSYTWSNFNSICKYLTQYICTYMDRSISGNFSKQSSKVRYECWELNLLIWYKEADPW